MSQCGGHAFTSSKLSEPPQADAIIIAVKDDAIDAVAAAIGDYEGVALHTAGSVPMSIFSGNVKHYGVLYPMQTFTKGREVDFRSVHCFIEGSDDTAYKVIREVAESISDNVHDMTSDNRRYLHLAAVFACNFTNHCYTLAADILEKRGIPFDTLLPLIDETAAKVHAVHPAAAQTGPAIRYDETIINAHIALLDDEMKAAIYELLSQSIHAHDQL